MTKYLAIALLITGFLVGDAYGNSVGDLIRKSKEDLKKIEADKKKEYFSSKPINPEQKKMFEKKLPLAVKGDARAQWFVGSMLYKGLGVPRDAEKGIEWLKLSFKNRFVQAASSLARIYEDGYGVKRDYKESVKWRKLAAESGVDYYYMFSLGSSYFSGGKGFVQDYVLAHKWWNLALSIYGQQELDSEGKEKAITANPSNEEVLRTFLSIAEENMTLGQITEAQRLAREWNENNSKINYTKPDKKKLIAEAQRLLREWNENNSNKFTEEEYSRFRSLDVNADVLLDKGYSYDIIRQYADEIESEQQLNK